jgi:hypothetical protein
MTLFRYLLAGFLGAAIIGGLGSARAAGIVVEVIVLEDGSAEINCPTSACRAVCRDVEGQSLLVQGEFYRIGSNCTVELSDGALLQEAVEELIALIGEEIPAGDETQVTVIEINEDEFDSGETPPANNTENQPLSANAPVPQ